MRLLCPLNIAIVRPQASAVQKEMAHRAYRFVEKNNDMICAA
jgi:hypothetical protein